MLNKKIFLHLLLCVLPFSFVYSSTAEDDIFRFEALLQALPSLNRLAEPGTEYSPGSRVYLDSLEEADVLSVFNQPGHDSHSCGEDKKLKTNPSNLCKIVGWLDRDTFVYTINKRDKLGKISPMKVTISDEKSEDEEDGSDTNSEEYSLIYFRYTRSVVNPDTFDVTYETNEGFGWVPTDYLVSKLYQPFYPLPHNTSNNEGNYQTNNQNITPEQNSTPSHPLRLTDIMQIAESVKPYVGKCFKPSPSHKSLAIPFDSIILPDLLRINLHQTGLSRWMNQSDFITIDALARSIYGEMSRCFRKGLHYPMAVARIAFNRSQTDGKSFQKYTYVENKMHSEKKSKLSKVITTPSQFNIWIPKKVIKIQGRKTATSAYSQALCPPSQPNKKFYRGYLPDSNELNIWNHALKIAIETVLFPESLKRRTRMVKGFHYTSGLKKSKFHGMTQQNPTPIIEGRKVSDKSCLQIWTD